MIRHASTVRNAAVVLLFIYGGAAQYDSCTNGTIADIGNGRCDAVNNNPPCGFDGGDCCSCTCADGPLYSCTDSDFDCLYPDCDEPAATSDQTGCFDGWKSDGYCDGLNNTPSCGYDGGDCCECSCEDHLEYSCGFGGYDCKDPTCFDPTIVAEFPDCTGDWLTIGDGSCGDENNNPSCGYDLGDCCLCSCQGINCVTTVFECLDPTADDELYDCEAPPPIALPCSADAQRAWVVETSAQAQALAAAVNCSGGSFDVEWRGSVVVDEPFSVTDGTVLTLWGADASAVVNGNWSTRLFTVVNASLHLSDVNITSGASIVGGAIAVAGSSLTLNGASFVLNNASGNGGAVYVSDGSNMSCVGGGTFANNGASLNGGAMFVTGRSTAFCGGVWLSNAAGGSGGAVSVSDDSTMSWSQESTFAYNRAGSTGGALFIVSRSLASWSASTTFLANQAGLVGGALYAGDSSDVSWTGEASTVFDGNQAQVGGGVLVLSNSRVSCTEKTITTFSRNLAVISGGGLSISSSSSAFFGGNISFEGNSAIGDPEVYESGFGGALVVASGSNASWSGHSSTFSSNSAEKVAGGILVSASDLSWSGETDFVGNSAAWSGGGIFILNGSSVSWTGDTEFTSNEAGADGGAIGSPTLDSSFNLEGSDLVINGPAAFVNNTCGANGGALALYEGLSVDIYTAGVSFVGNTAEVAGGAVFVAGAGVGLVFINVSFVSNSAQLGGAASTVGSGNLKGFFDIESPNPTTFNQCRFVDNRAAATGGAIESAVGQDSIANSMFKSNQAGVGGALRLAGTASLENCSFVDNVSDDGGGAAVSNIGSISTMVNVSFSENVFHCQTGMFLEYIAGDTYEAACDGCQTACDGCSFDDPPLVPTCSDALENSNSSGGTLTLEMLSIKPGYWRATASSPNVLACYHADACLGGVTGALDYCLEGYEGPYCAICRDGYTAHMGMTCSKCSNNAGGIVLAAALAVAALVVSVAVVSYVTSGKGGGRTRGVVERLGRYIPLQSVKIVIVAWQILTQFTSVANVTYPDVYQRFLDVLVVFNFDLGWILSAGCVVDVDFHGRLLISTITPIAGLLFLAGVYAAAARINRGSTETLQRVWHKHVSMVLLLTYLVYASVSATLFKSFACEKLDDGNNYLRADYRIKCDSSKHRAFQAYAGFMVVLYTVGIPALYGALLFKDSDVLKRDQPDREGLASITPTSDLWKPYKPSVFYYEVIECARRILLAGVVVFIYPNTGAQIAVTLLMAFVFAMLSEALGPYASRWDTWLSRMGHAVITVSMYVALLLKVDVSDERASSQKVFEILLVAAHVCMVVVILAEMIVQAISLWAEKRQNQPPSTCFGRGKSVFGLRRRGAYSAEAEEDPFSGDIYHVELQQRGDRTPSRRISSSSSRRKKKVPQLLLSKR